MLAWLALQESGVRRGSRYVPWPNSRGGRRHDRDVGRTLRGDTKVVDSGNLVEGQIPTAPDTLFLQNCSDVGLHGSRPQAGCRGDLRVRESSFEKPQNHCLASGQFEATAMDAP